MNDLIFYWFVFMLLFFGITLSYSTASIYGIIPSIYGVLSTKRK